MNEELIFSLPSFIGAISLSVNIYQIYFYVLERIDFGRFMNGHWEGILQSNNENEVFDVILYCTHNDKKQITASFHYEKKDGPAEGINQRGKDRLMSINAPKYFLKNKSWCAEFVRVFHSTYSINNGDITIKSDEKTIIYKWTCEVISRRKPSLQVCIE